MVDQGRVDAAAAVLRKDKEIEEVQVVGRKRKEMRLDGAADN